MELRVLHVHVRGLFTYIYILMHLFPLLLHITTAKTD